MLLWDAATGSLKRTLNERNSHVTEIALAPNGRLLASGTAGSTRKNEISLWDRQSGKLLRRLPGHKGKVQALAFSPDGKILASGSETTKSEQLFGEVKLWNAQTGRLLRTITGHSGWVSSLAFAPNGKTLVGGSAWSAKGVGKGDWQLWDVSTGKLLRHSMAPQDWVTSIAFAPDGSTLASGSRDKTVRLWDARSGKLLHALGGHADIVKSVKFAPDGSTLASGSKDKTIRLWDARSGKPLRVLRGHEFGVWAVAFAPDGKRLASGSADTSVRLWDVAGGRELAKLLTAPADDPQMSGPAWMAVTPEGYYHCSEGADYLFKWRFRSRLVPFYRFEETYRRPDILRRALRGERIAARPLTLARIPPSCWILDPQHDADIQGDALRVLVGVTDDEAAPVDLRMFVNGVLVPETIAKPITANAKPIMADGKPITADGKPITAEGKPITADGKEVPAEHHFSRIITIDVPLPPGEQNLNLRAVVYDSEKNKFDAAVTVRRSKVAPVLNDLYVLCVGVSQYRNPNYNLNFAAADANAIASLLKAQQGRQYSQVHVNVLTDRQATAQGIRAALKALQKARASDTVMVFLSGHGLQSEGKSYFAPWGTFINDIAGTCLPWQEMMSGLSQLYAKKLLFTDACHSGSKLGAWQATNEQLAQAARRRTGVVMLSSSQGDEFSFEERDLQHGAFTVALMEAFNGKADVDGNNAITLPELALYVPKRVSALTKGLQNPHLVLVQDFNPQTPLTRVAPAQIAGRG